MCPACLGVAAACVAGAGSIGGATILFFKRFGRHESADQTNRAVVKDQVRNDSADSDPGKR